MYSLITVVFALIFVVDAQIHLNNNVCKSWIGYWFSPIFPDCYYEKDVFSNTPERLERYVGKEHVQKYTVTTDDGYILTMFRIVRRKPKGVVVLQHPMLTDSVIWMSQINESTALEFWRKGYDVWLPNNRGTWYSEKHVNLTINQLEYWNFGFHEIGIHDYVKFLEKISEVTNNTDIIVISHSMSTTASLAYATMKPDHAAKHVKLFIELSPVANFYHIESPTRLISPLHKVIRLLSEIVGIGGFLIKNGILTYIIRLFVFFPFKQLIVFLLTSTSGYTTEFDPRFINILLATNVRGTSLGLVYHYSQIVQAGGRFQMYDYGKEHNLKLYNSEISPLYPLERIKVPFYLISSYSDTISTVKDTQILYDDLPPTAKIYGQQKVTNMNHVDFHFGRNRFKVYDNIFKLLSKIM